MNGGAYIQGLAYKWNRKSALKEAMLSNIAVLIKISCFYCRCKEGQASCSKDLLA